MRFAPTEEQDALAEAVDDVIEGAGGTAIARAWSHGDTAPGLALWRGLAELGLLGLRIEEEDGGVSATDVDLVVAFERLGRSAVPGPYIESAALLPALVDADLRPTIADGSAIASASVEGVLPYGLDADVATHLFVVTDGSIAAASAGADEIRSLDPTRRLRRLTAEGASRAVEPNLVSEAVDRATLAASAMLLGAGERLLAEAVSYAKVREQFGRAIGEYQAIKHRLADVRVALTFARPLLWAAALDSDAATRSRSVSAAKVATGEAADLAARAALQVHGAIGYTEEHDLGLWITRVRALNGSWGTPARHRASIARALLKPAD